MDPTTLPLQQLVDRMLLNDEPATREFVTRQQPTTWSGLVAICDRIDAHLFHLMLRDAAAFMKHKWPDPLPRVNPDLLRYALEGHFTSDSDRFDRLTLDELTAFKALINKVQTAAKLAADGKLRRTVLNGYLDVQNSLFPELRG